MNDESDDLTKVHLDLPNHWWFKGESLWAKHLGDDLYEIQNIPFCAYGLNCGDVVRATPDAPDQSPEVREVVRRSGNRTLRVTFNVDKERQTPYLETIESMGAWIERADSDFICINVPPAASYEKVRDYLAQEEANGSLEYETCEERLPGSFDDTPESEGDDDG